MRTTTKLAGLAAAVGALALGAAFIQPSSADEEPQPIGVELLTPRSEFTDEVGGQIRLKLDGQTTNVLNMADLSKVATAKITVQPGARFPWHTHPGPVIANVAQGELTYVYASDCVERPYPAGTLFIDPGHGNVHTAFNPTDEVTVVYATFFEVPATGALTIPVDDPGTCEMTVGSHAH
jgi:predicted metal-dependent enzyme (double-stranded beta helix superfamily)